MVGRVGGECVCVVDCRLGFGLFSNIEGLFLLVLRRW